ncbi:MAG: DUF2304 domain-containing protein [Oscillospiraceae bacterium]|nr:DUF2304 domain-containing protein [Oscillospiraceae bacterium]
MISLTLRTLLIAGSLLTLAFMLYRIRISKIQIRDAIFWIFFLLLMLLFSVFPRITLWFSRLLDIQSPINFVLLFVIFILVIQLFFACMRISQLDAKLRKITQRIGIDQKDGGLTTYERKESDDSDTIRS